MKKNKKSEDIFNLLQKPVEAEAEPELKETTIFDFLNDLSYEKKYILDDENKKKLKVFMLNRYFSASMLTVLYAQEVNIRTILSVEMAYDYYFYALKKKKLPFLKWLKQDKTKEVELLMKHYSYNRQKAKEVLKLHSPAQLKEIENLYFEGGQKKMSAK